MTRYAAARRGVVGATALAGAVIGHDVTYLLTVPDPNARTALLGETGHGYWFAAVAASIVLGAVAVGTTLARHFRTAAEGGTAGETRLIPLTRRLVVLQVAVFVVQEITERLVVGASLSSLLHHQMAAGVAVQVVVAFLAAVLLCAFARTAETAGHALRRPRVALRVAGRLAACSVSNARAVELVGSRRTRAPPSYA